MDLTFFHLESWTQMLSLIIPYANLKVLTENKPNPFPMREQSLETIIEHYFPYVVSNQHLLGRPL